jgi:DNA-binding NarL/FixJ family response regulator
VLPEREQAVLRLLADGLGNAQIAQALNVSVSTIRRETSSLYHRLSVGNRASAVTRAHALGLL